MRIFEEGFGIEINILQEIIDYVLKRNVKMMRQFVVYYRNNFIILLHAQNYLTDHVYFFAVWSFLVGGDRLEDYLRVLTVFYFSLQFMEKC